MARRAAPLTAIAARRAPDDRMAQQCGRPYGFADASGATQREFERRFLTLPSADRIRDAHRYLTDQPHLAGSPRDRELAEWTRDQFRRSGLDDVEITTHEVLLPWPQEVTVEMTAPRAWRASMREEPVAGGSVTRSRHTRILESHITRTPRPARSRRRRVCRERQPADYDWLQAQGIDVRGKIVLVRYSVPYSYRGFKALTAQTRGAAGILMFSDPALDGGVKGKIYPEGPWGP